MSSYLEIQLAQQPIELCKLLKVADLVGGGGEAKIVISEGYVLLNGEVEFQKRKKVYHNDVVEFNGEVIQVIINESFAEQVNEPKSSNSVDEAIKPSDKKQNNESNENNKNKEPRKRKPISF